MPRHVYRVSIELLDSDPPESYNPELDFIAELRGRVMGTPGLVRYPEDVTEIESWGKALRRGEPHVIEIDIDRDKPDAAGREILLDITQFLSPISDGDYLTTNLNYPIRIVHDPEIPQGEVRLVNEAGTPLGYITGLSTPYTAELASGEPLALRCTCGKIRQPWAGTIYTVMENIHHRFDGLPCEETLRTSAEWQDLKPIKVLDPDGWREGSSLGPADWDKLISEAEFDNRAAESTVAPLLHCSCGAIRQALPGSKFHERDHVRHRFDGASCEAFT
jgi:hypothetical protein